MGTTLVRQYLMDELEIPEIEPEQFGRTITEAFMSNQRDEWMIEFYKL